MKDEIKKALEKATPGPWNKEGVEVWRRGTGYNTSEDAHIWICDAFNGENAHLIANAPTWLKWQNERIEQLEDAVESLYQLIQRGDLTSFDLKEADNVLQALGKEE